MVEEPCQCSECKSWLRFIADVHDVVIDGEVTQDALDDWVRDGEGEEEQDERMEKAERLREDAYEHAHLSFCESCDNQFHEVRGNINVHMLDETITSPHGQGICTVCSLCQRRPDIRDQLRRRDPWWEADDNLDEHAAARRVLDRLALQAMAEHVVQRRNARGDQLRENDEPDQ